MKWKYILPAGLLACAMWNVQNVYAQDPITFTDENGERVSYGEQKEWTRTIEYVFPDDSNMLRNTVFYEHEIHMGGFPQCDEPTIVLS